jgi:DNA-binding transcriptional LysR family regulator
MQPMVDWTDLRFFLAVANAGSVTQAARALRVDKATVSRRVSALEKDLGMRLVVRRAAGWRPTRAGQRVAAAAAAMDGQATSMLSDLVGRHGAPRTPVSITAPHWFCRRLLVPALPALLTAAPWLDVAVAASSRVMNLAQREADVAVRKRRPDDGDFVLRRAGDLGSAIYASRAYVKRHGAELAEGAVGDHRVVGYHDRVSYVPGFAWLEAAFDVRAATFRGDDAEVILEAIRAGVGVGVVPCVLGDADRGLVRIGAPQVERIWLVSPTELASTRAVKLTLAFVVDVFRANEAALAGVREAAIVR